MKILFKIKITPRQILINYARKTSNFDLLEYAEKATFTQIRKRIHYINEL